MCSSDLALIDEAIEWAMKLLGDSRCSDIFGSPTVLGTFGHSAQSILGQLRDSDSLRFARTGFVFNAVTDFQQVVAGGIRLSWSASLWFNRDQRGNPRELTHSIIHELGHVLRPLGWVGGTFQERDSGELNLGNQQNNNAEIWRRSFGVVGP